MEDLKKRQADVDRARAIWQKRIGRRCDWADPTDIAFLKSADRAARREALLDRLAPNRRCPSCRRLFLKSAEWVVRTDGSGVICRSCYHTGADALGEPFEFPNPIFLSTIVRVAIDGHEVRHAREIASCSQADFARRVGWSRTHQRRLETGEVASVDLPTAMKIHIVLSELLIVVLGIPEIKE